MGQRVSAGLIVVGAGSSGAVIAARVTERSDRDVLLLEAGPDYPDSRALPSDLIDGTKNSMIRHDWGYHHRPNPRQVVFRFPRGRVVGGSSAVNTCIALRGQPYDYDEWADRGLSDWGWDKCLPAFKRLENDLDIQNEWHSQDGPIPIRRHKPEELAPWQAAFVETCLTLGYPPCADTNDPTTTGVGPHAMNKIEGQRMSAARCYLLPDVRRRDNLKIRANTLVRRVRFRNRRVTGLELETLGRVYDVPARRVVLCAGAIGTPGILLRSGIGPRRTVERLGVELVMDAPRVGARLLDHPGAGILLWPRRGSENHRFPLIQTVLRYTSRGSPYRNDMQLQAASFTSLPWFPLPMVLLTCCVGKPRGHGRIDWPDANPRSSPRIDSRLFVDEDDRARALDALELAWRVANSGRMKGMAKAFWPGEATASDRSRLDGFLWRICDSGYHPCGTVPMGKEGDPDAAVSGRGRVRGVEGLWVADASIMPTIPSSNTNLPTLMIGERFGEWFRDGE
jgi:choline dehydrogenase